MCMHILETEAMDWQPIIGKDDELNEVNNTEYIYKI